MDFSAPITEVTVMEDRACVVRTGKTDVEGGYQRLRIEGVSPIIIDKTISVKPADPGLNVVDVRVKREWIAKDEEAPEQIAELKKEAEALRLEIVELDARTHRTMAELEDLRSMAGQFLQSTSEDSAWNRFDGGKSTAGMALLSSSQEQLTEMVVDLEFELRSKNQEMARLQARIDQAKSPATTHRASIELDVESALPGEVELRIYYVVPNAMWRPSYRARLLGDQVQVECLATVWQNTGEVWEGTELRFSTERPSLGGNPPLLDEDVLHTKLKDAQIEAVEREETLHDPGLGHKGFGSREEIPGLDDQGEPMSLRAQSREELPSDGRPHQVPLFDFASKTEGSLVVFGELEQAALRRTKQTHTGTHPLLPGPVDLIRDAGLAGKTRIDFIALGESFYFNWGPDPAVRVHRIDAKSSEKSKSLSSWHETRHEVEVKLSNLSGNGRILEVTERVPISEIEKVRVDYLIDKVTDGIQPDENGFVRWKVKLEPHGHETYTLAYVLRRHDSVRLS